ncbi:MAG: lytic murein transglycosylase [Desulfovibrionaceae bacterium]
MPCPTARPAPTPLWGMPCHGIGHVVRLLCALLAFLAAPGVPPAVQAGCGEWEELVGRLAADGYPRALVEPFFTRSDMAYQPDAMLQKMATLFQRKFAPKPKQTAKKTSPAPAIYPSAMEPKRIADARAFCNRHAATLTRVRREFGVPHEIAVAILSVETQVGRYLGEEPAFVTLASMAHTDRVERLPRLPHLGADTPPTAAQRTWLARRIKEKSDWAYGELKALIDHAAANGHHPLDLPGSVYGAIGMCQFMPSNALRFGMDGDGDGRINLFTPPDALYSLANFLKANGWKKGLSLHLQRKVLYRYNHSRMYTNTVLAVAKRLLP